MARPRSRKAMFVHAQGLPKRRRRPALGLNPSPEVLAHGAFGDAGLRGTGLSGADGASIASRRRFAVMPFLVQHAARTFPPKSVVHRAAGAGCSGDGAFIMKSITCRFRKDNILK